MESRRQHRHEGNEGALGRLLSGWPIAFGLAGHATGCRVRRAFVRGARWTAAAVLLMLALLTPAPAVAAEPSPACDQSRSALDYRAGGGQALGQEQWIPCRYATGADAGEPSFGFGRSGQIFYETWDLDAPANPSGVLRSGRERRTWTDVSPSGLVTSFDPFLLVDPRTKRIFDANFAGNGSFECETISYSDDSGSHWTTNATCGHGFDGGTIGVGPPVYSKTTGYPNVVYFCAGGSLGTEPPPTSPVCSKSLDGGVTFTSITSPYPTEGAFDKFASWGGPPVVASDGTVYLPKRYAGEPQIAISHNEGASWTRVQVASNGSASEANRVVIDRRGNLYYTWLSANHMPYLATSRDGGKTWTAPLALAPAGLRETAVPDIAVDSASGRAAVVYLGSVDAPGVPPYFTYCMEFLETCPDGAYPNATWNGYMTLVDNPLAKRPVLHTATVNRPEEPLFVGGCSAEGGCKANMDFLDVHFDATGHPWGAFVDDCKLTAEPTSNALFFNPQAGHCEDGTGEGVLLELRAGQEEGP